MSDERDETRKFSPFDDATWADDPSPMGRTRPQPRAGDNPTVVDGPPAGQRRDDATSVLPPATGSPAWSGRAEVRAPQPEPVDAGWPGAATARPRERWWMPILVGVIVLVLLAALGWGIYLIVQNAGTSSNSPGPAVSTAAPPAPSTATTTSTTEPTSAPATTTTTPSPSFTEPTNTGVAIPALRGLSVADAKTALARVGIGSTRVIYRPSGGEPNTVIDSDPEEGRAVPPDTTVTLVVAAPSTTTPDSPATAGN